MDNRTIKNQARAVIRSQRKPILISSALFLALSLLIGYLRVRLVLPSGEQLMQLSDRFYDLILAGDYNNASKLANSFQPRFAESLVSDVLSYFLAIVSFGFLAVLFRALRGEKVAPAMLLDGFASWAKVLLVELFIRLIVTFGLWVLIVPGILFFYNYRMARYLLLTHPDYGVLDCLRESRQRMREHRMSLFLLDLSFIGWALLSCVPLVGQAAAFWALPYWNCSCLLMYEAINSGYEANPPDPHSGQNRFPF